LSEEQQVSLSEVQNMRSGINTKGVLKSKGEVRTVNMKRGGTIDVCDAVLSDDSGEIKFTLWGDDIAKVNEGDTIAIKNGYTNTFKGEVSLGKGKFGEMTITPKE
jgi:replication factor A1